MSHIPLEKKFRVLCGITRSMYFLWLQTIKQLCPNIDENTLILKYWENLGHETAQSYIKHMDLNKPILSLAESIIFSSQCMGESADIITSRDNEVLIRWTACPWIEWYSKFSSLEKDQLGCDKWLEVIISDLNKSLGLNIAWGRLKSLPKGEKYCEIKIYAKKM
jgi:hypothetical protein